MRSAATERHCQNNASSTQPGFKSGFPTSKINILATGFTLELQFSQIPYALLLAEEQIYYK